MKVIIIAGGQGTRIASVNKEIPKAMIPVCGKPVLERQIEMAKKYGYSEFIFLIGYLGNQIQEYFGDGSKWNIHIDYYHENRPLGTAGALAEIIDLLSNDFFIFYGDTIMDIDMNRMLDYHFSHHADATLFVHPNDHPFDSDIVILGKDNRIKNFAYKPHSKNFISHNIVNAALFIFNKKIINFIERGKKAHIEKDIFPKCIKKNMKLYGYVSSEYVKDMGTPERYYAVCHDWKTGRVQALNMDHKRKAVFLDRDGVLNIDNGLVFTLDKMELIEQVEKGLNYIHQKGYLAIIVTNQSVIARNLCTFNELDTINAKMETLLGKKHTYIDALYFCPHHPDSGYPEERKEYKIQCECRKPAPGLLLKAAKELNINLAESIMIGDRESDISAGTNAHVKRSILIPTNIPGALLTALKKEI
ncbi:D-glycero-beta-D-manno-heptose 1,7-bisphosphate 7-phosphatase [Hoylesella oralis]|uniref:D-glycero-beta-D-manno-heptose 1,7-bisphosphate 7-phosphatase n=1 Tax=Hoylesella oralis TaxID=28134 RepID=UPI0028EFE185|nr:D-glycero-beta-D-manno-heptose 1,7-bisphosphate 7-phosphatase [Hoylesella oralis]